MPDIALSKWVATASNGQPFAMGSLEITVIESGNSGLKICVRRGSGTDDQKGGQCKCSAGEKMPLVPSGTGAPMRAAQDDYLLTIFQVPSAWRQAVP